ncbi:beta strand repeat-containing protein [Haloferula rosea]|uniref:Autotransporter-associated beta strand repeat-containing protein n=1 Tax=Haloferula rosea TaxID=490093 RepID=A0A934VDY0_9BACT|nr:autotransporter-associated beta strand repeat-containing protein [Haloferula rosea]MBK1826744.1 autotransporter-associated beta strand repeat-containing protein [Haloferula rosea]
MIACTRLASAAELVKWDIPTGSVATVPPQSTVAGLTATNLTPVGCQNQSNSGAWRVNNFNGTDDYIEFTLTTDSASTVTLESLIFTARARAASGSGDDGEWTDPELILEYSTSSDYSSLTSGGTLDLGPTLLAGDEGTDFSSLEATFFGTDLVISPSTTYYFRLRASNATGLRISRNQLYFNSTDDMVINGSVASASSDLLWAGADGANWNTTELNFTNGGSPSLFTTGDQVTIDTAGGIVVDAGGVEPSNLIVTTGSGLVTLSGGSVTAATLSKSGNSDLSLSGTNSFVGGVSITDGSIIPNSNDSLGSGTINMDGGEINTPSSVTEIANVIEIGAAGGTLDTDDNVTFSEAFSATGGAVEASHRLLKRGSGTLTLSKTGTAFGSQSNVGAAGTSLELDIVAGSVVFEGNGSRFLGGTCDWDAPVTINGGLVMLHGSTIEGTGTISIPSSSTLEARFNRGDSFVENDILLSNSADLSLDCPTGTTSLNIDGEIDGDGNIVTIGNGIVRLTSDNDYTGTTTVSTGTLVLDGSFSNGGQLGSGDVSIAAGATLSVDRGGEVDLTNLITGDGTLILTGTYEVFGGVSSRITLGGANTYTGATEIRGGTVEVPVLADGLSPSSLGAADVFPFSLLLQGGATLDYTGPTASTNREFRLGPGGATIAANGTGPLSFTSTFAMVGEGTGVAERTLTLSGTAPGISSFGMVIEDGINAIHNVVKAGPNTWALTADNIYSGTTTVTEGILRIDGNNLGLGAITIQDGAALGGTGSSGGVATIESGGGLAVTISDWTGVAGVGFDQLALEALDAGSVPMTLTIDSTGLANFVDEAKSFTILTTFSGITNFTSGNVTISAPGFPGVGSWTLSESAGSLVLDYTATPASDYDDWAGPAGFNLVEGPTGDDDGDGVSNEDEYAFGLDPTDGSSVNPIAVALDKTAGTFSYTRRDPALGTNLSYAVWTSTDLDDWIEDDTAVQTPGVTDGDGNQTVGVTLTAAPTAPAFFVRVIATEIPE